MKGRVYVSMYYLTALRWWTGSHWSSWSRSWRWPSWPAGGREGTPPSWSPAPSGHRRHSAPPDSSTAPALASGSQELAEKKYIYIYMISNMKLKSETEQENTMGAYGHLEWGREILGGGGREILGGGGVKFCRLQSINKMLFSSLFSECLSRFRPGIQLLPLFKCMSFSVNFFLHLIKMYNCYKIKWINKITFA